MFWRCSLKDNYVTDISDYGKYGLLRYVCEKSNLRLGVNWYRTEPDIKHQRKDKYLSFEKYALYDVELFNTLKKISLDRKLSIDAIQQSNIFPEDTIFYGDILSAEISSDERRKWHCKAADKLKHTELIFLDPDNGLIPKTMPNIKDRLKYVFYPEIADYLHMGKSIICFQYRYRPADVTGEKSLVRYKELIEKVRSQGIHDVNFITLTFEINIPEGAIAVDYLLFIQNKHNYILEICKQFERTSWSGVIHILGDLE